MNWNGIVIAADQLMKHANMRINFICIFFTWSHVNAVVYIFHEEEHAVMSELSIDLTVFRVFLRWKEKLFSCLCCFASCLLDCYPILCLLYDFYPHFLPCKCSLDVSEWILALSNREMWDINTGNSNEPALQCAATGQPYYRRLSVCKCARDGHFI